LTGINNGLYVIYFVQIPAKSGGITFFNPSLLNEIDGLDSWVRDNTYDVKTGQIFIFPSWLRSQIQQNQSKNRGETGERISISFAFTLDDDGLH